MQAWVTCTGSVIINTDGTNENTFLRKAKKVTAMCTGQLQCKTKLGERALALC